MRFLFQDGTAVFTFWLVIATAVLGLIAIIQLGYLERAEILSAQAAKAAKDSADTARDTLIATQRPWVGIEVSVGSDLIFNKDGAKFTTSYTLANSGNTPALNVEIVPTFFLFDWGKVSDTNPNVMERQQTRPDNELRKLCRGAVASSERKTSVEWLLGDSIFPGKELTSAVTQTIAQADFEREGRISSSGIALPMIMLCVTYRYPADTKSHYTGVAYIITRKKGGDIKPKEGTIAANDLQLIPQPFSSGMAN